MQEKVLRLINEQINAEMYSAYLYLSMSSWCERQNQKGMANWMRVQAQEELFHATYMHDYLVEMGEEASFSAIAAPPSEWASPSALFADVLAHEQKVTAMINHIADAALEAREHRVYQFILLYVKEQVEEESSASDLLYKVKMSQGNAQMLYALDASLAARVFTPPFGEVQA